MRPGLVKQPSNTWSNLGFVAAGLMIAWALSSGRFRHYRNPLTESAWAGICFSSLVVLLGPGSMAMHASGTHAGAFFDGLSMYLIAAFLVAYSSFRLFRLRSVFLLLIFVATLAINLWASRHRSLSFVPGNPGNTSFAFCILLTIAFEVLNALLSKKRRSFIWGYASVGVVGLAFFIWNMSLTGRPWCVPDSLLQGHAAWHLLDALSLYCLFRYYVMEQQHPLPLEVGALPGS